MMRMMSSDLNTPSVAAARMETKGIFQMQNAKNTVSANAASIDLPGATLNLHIIMSAVVIGSNAAKRRYIVFPV